MTGETFPQASGDSGVMKSPYFEDFKVGQRFAAPWGRTITDAHVLAFSGITGDFQHLHVDDEYAGRSEFGGRIAHGPLTAVTALGMQVYTQVWRHAMAFLEEQHKYRAPVHIGDTIFTVMEVMEARRLSRGDAGIVTFLNSITNQTGDQVCETTYVMMIRARSEA